MKLDAHYSSMSTMTRLNRRALLVVTALSFTVVTSRVADASPVTFALTGPITDTFGSIDGVPMLPFSVGDTISGTFTFDSSAVDTISSDELGIYSGTPIALSISVGSLEIEYDFLSSTVSCNVPAYCSGTPAGDYAVAAGDIIVEPRPTFGQNFVVNWLVEFPSEPIPRTFQVLHLRTSETAVGQEVILTDDLPAVPFDVNAFLITAGEFGWDAPDSTGSTTDYNALFTIDTLTLFTPPPAAPAFGAAGIIILTALLVVASTRTRQRAGSTREEARVRKRLRGLVAGAAAVAFCIATATASAFNVQHVVVALEGAPAPGTAGAIFEGFYPPAISENGWIVFKAYLVEGVGDTDSTNRGGIWTLDPNTGAVTLRLREGQPAPGTSAEFSFFSNPKINQAGDLAFWAALKGPQVNTDNDSGFWGPDALGATTLIAREGDSAPGVPEGIFTLLTRPRLNDARRVLLWTNLGSEIGIGFYTSDAGSPVELLFGAGDVIPGTGGLVARGGNSSQRLNQSGEAAITVYINQNQPGVTTANDQVLLGPDGLGGFRFIAREGDPAPGLPGVNFGNMGNGPTLSDSNAVSFWDGLSVWLSELGQPIRMVAGPGSALVGTTDTVIYAGTTGWVSMNENLEFAFRGRTTNNCRVILFVNTGGDIHRVADCEDPVPDRPGFQFRDVDDPVLNDLGTLAFQATYDDTPNPYQNGIFVTGPGLQPELVVGSGDAISVAPGDVRTVLLTDLIVEQNGRQYAVMSQANHLVYRLYFEGITQAIVLSTLTLEPPVPVARETAALLALALLLAGASVLSIRSRRSQAPTAHSAWVK